MLPDPRLVILALFAAFSVLAVLRRTTRLRLPLGPYCNYLWTFFLFFTVAEFWSFRVAIWILALLCYLALKEYFTLVDLRLQDRWGILGAYLSIPFMIYYIQIDWYGMFIISIPVYAFLVIPFLISLGGGEPRGTVFSIGVIDLGLFLLVYCIGHIGYLSLHSTWRAILVILAVTVFDLCSLLIRKGGKPTWSRAALRYAAAAPLTTALVCALSGWTGIPLWHSVVLGLLIPACAVIGRHTIAYIEEDLGVERKRLLPGKGQILDSLKSFLYTAPVVFHYIRYFVE